MSSSEPETVRPRRALVFVNERARRGESARDAIAHAFDSAALPAEIHLPDSARAMCDAIRACASAGDRIVIAGGDGTIRGALAAVIETGLPLGVVPLGTANDLARTLGIPTGIDAACAIAAGDRTAAIDVGRANDCWFLNTASLGLSEAVTQRLSSARKARWGIVGYALGVRDALDAARSFSVTLTCDGDIHRFRSLQVVIGNGRHYGGGATVAADAAIDDGLLDVYSLDPQGWRSLLTIALPLYAGRHGGLDQVRSFRGRRIEVRTRRRKRVDTDGEMTTHTPLTVEVRSALLEVFIAASTTAPGLTGEPA